MTAAVGFLWGLFNRSQFLRFIQPSVTLCTEHCDSELKIHKHKIINGNDEKMCVISPSASDKNTF